MWVRSIGNKTCSLLSSSQLSRTETPLRTVQGCMPQACKPCTCPASKLKKEPWGSDRDVNCLMDGGSYTSEARSWSDTPHGCGRQWAGHGSSLGSQGKRAITTYRRELTSGWLIHYQGNQQRGMPLTVPLINYHSGDSFDFKMRTVTSWDGPST